MWHGRAPVPLAANLQAQRLGEAMTFPQAL
jgi:hypothetical protein